jgi:photoactive yellow protein
MNATTSNSFVPSDVLSRISSMSPSKLNSLDFGVVQVDDSGVIEFYNRYESEMAGVDPSIAEGGNFFTEVAPCSNNRLFRGRFEDGVASGQLDETFSYTFTYKMKPTLVDVHLYRDGASQTNWIFVKKQ